MLQNDDDIIHMKIRKLKKKASSKYWNIPTFQRRLLLFVLIFTISNLVGILTIYFTTSKARNVACPFRFIQLTEDWSIIKSRRLPVAVGDFNSDDHIDIVVTEKETTKVYIFFGYGNGTFPRVPTTVMTCFSLPYSISVGDFNGDQSLDIVIAYHDDNCIGILFGSNDGKFNTEIRYSTDASRPISVSVHDLNGDTFLDILTVNDGTNSVAIFRGYGNGTFALQEEFSTGFDSRPRDIAVNDLNSDNRLDIVVVNSGTNSIGIFFADETGKHFRQITYSTEIQPSSVSVNYLNNDTLLDIVVSNYYSDSISIFFGNGNGIFRNQVIYATGFGSKPSSIVMCDLNKDGYSDILCAYSGNNYLGLFIGVGDGTFKNQRLYATDGGASQMIVPKDLNNDSWIDLVISIDDSYNVGIFLGSSDKNFTNPMTFSTGARSRPFFVATGDFNDDDVLDIAVANYDTDCIGVLMGHGNGQFQSIVTYSTGAYSRPWSLTLGDFNHDKNLDIVVANYIASNIGIFIGNGDGTFQSQKTYTTGRNNYPRFVINGDFNQDGELDIAVTIYKHEYITIFLGHGNGTFSRRIVSIVGSYWYSIATGDFNSDHHLDLVLTNQQNYYAIILIGDAKGSFSTKRIYLRGLESSSSGVVIGNFNDDNQLDLAILLEASMSIQIFLGNGDGTFKTVDSYPTDRGPKSIAIGDLNNDTQTDLIVVNYYSDNINVYLGNGDGTFSAKLSYSLGYQSYPSSVVIGDFNSDNYPDVAVALSYYFSIGILIGYFNSPFTNSLIYSSSFISLPYALQVADFNNDSLMDIAVIDRSNANIGIHFNSQDGTFEKPVLYSTGYLTGPSSIAVADLNNDNQSDILVTNYNNDKIILLLTAENGTFEKSMPYTTGTNSNPTFVSANKLDENDRVDIVTANTGDSSINVFLHYGFGSFSTAIKYPTASNLPSRHIAIGDFNEDNLMDLVISNYGTSTIAVLLANENGSFSTQSAFSTQYLTPFSIAVGDFNKDAHLDILVANQYYSTVSTLLGNGNGTFSNEVIYNVGYKFRPTGVAISDFNNDSYLDFAVTTFAGYYIYIFLGNGNGTFFQVRKYSTGDYSWTWGVVITDLNNDARYDIVVANKFGFNIGVFIGNGDGTFSNQTAFETGKNSLPMSIEVNDFNNDGQIDVVVANYGTNTIGLFLGNGDGTFQNQLTHSVGAQSAPYWIGCGDFNRDNILDVAVTLALSDSLAICFGYGNGEFSEPAIFETGATTYPWYLIVHDFNNDGWLDIAVALGNVDGILMFEGSKTHVFLVSTKYSTGKNSRPQGIALGDFNNDKHMDIVVTCSNIGAFNVFLGQSRGNFTHQLIHTTGVSSEPWSIVGYDFNIDGALDIVIADRQSSNIVVFLGLGDGNFQKYKMYLTEPFADPVSITTLDFNKDSKMDLVVANKNASNIIIFFGHGDGTFGSPLTYLTGYQSRPVWITAIDLNADKWTDIAVVTAGTKSIKILSNKC